MIPESHFRVLLALIMHITVVECQSNCSQFWWKINTTWICPSGISPSPSYPNWLCDTYFLSVFLHTVVSNFLLTNTYNAISTWIKLNIEKIKKLIN